MTLPFPNSLTKVFLVYGPTNCGKTRLSLELAERYDGEIISADSRQVYEGLNIGTGKILPSEMRGIAHYGLNLISADSVYNAALFRDYARGKIQEISSKNKSVIICGGTGLYIDALLYDLDVPAFESDPKYQIELENYRQEYGNKGLWDRLYALDPDYANTLHPNSYPYVMRGLETIERTGQSKRHFHRTRNLCYDVLAITPYTDSTAHRTKLYESIHARVDQMIQQGLIDEVAGLIQKGYSADSPGLKTIGYAEILQALSGAISLDQAIELIKQKNRNYAKRQITWCKRYAALPHMHLATNNA